MKKQITYFGKQVIVACDEKCHYAFGRIRPRTYLDINQQKNKEILFGLRGTSIYPNEKKYPDGTYDVDNYALLTDREAGFAPYDNGNYEGDDAKPLDLREMGNKWCVRECERCIVVPLHQANEIKYLLPDFNKRRYNAYPHERD